MKEIPSPPDGLTPQQEISLYQGLLDCLEKEWRALVASQEDAILALAAEKDQLLEKIAGVSPTLEALQSEAETLQRLKHQVASAQSRNHRLIVTALETVQDFLGYLQSASPGIYHAAGKVEATPGNSFFHREA